MLRSKAGWALSGLVFFAPSLWAQSSATSSTKVSVSSDTRPFRLRGDWSFDLGGGSVQEAKNTAEGSYIYFSPNFEMNLLSDLKVRVSPWARFVSARIQDRFNDDEETGFLFVADAYLNYEPAPWLEARAGVLSQRDLRTSMMVSNLLAFPGARLTLKAPIAQNIEARTMFQHTIPTSTSGTADRDRGEQLPSFRTAQAELEVKRFLGWDLLGYGGYYDWSNLPATVAMRSSLRGNANVDGEMVTRFTRGYRGYFGGGSACFCDGLLGVSLDFKRMTNVEAQSFSADGQLVGGGPKLRWRRAEIDLRYYSYFIESDATVAAYNKSRLGHTNRGGDIIEGRLHLPEQKFSFYFEMYNARPLSVDDNQRDLRAVFIGVETDDVSLF